MAKDNDSIEMIKELMESLTECSDELNQLHWHHYPKCEGGCPSTTYINRAKLAIEKAKAVVQSNGI